MARGTLVAVALTSGCGKTGGKSSDDGDLTGVAAGSGRAAGGAGSSGGASVGSAGTAPSSGGHADSGGAAAVSGAGMTSSAGAGGAAGASGAAGGAGMPAPLACATDDDCPEAQRCDGKVCGCPTYSPDWCEADATCTTFKHDPQHCGGCQACGETEACNEGVCSPALSELASFPGCQQLLLQPALPWVYVLDDGSGKLWRLALGAADAPTLIASGLGTLNAFTVAGDTAYVANDSGIARVALSGGAVSTVAQASGPVHGVAEAGGKLFFSSGSEVRSIDANAEGGNGALVATAMNGGLPNGVVVSGDYVLFNADASFNLEAVQLGPKNHFKLSGPLLGMQLGHRSLQTDGKYVYSSHDGFLERNAFGGADTRLQNIGDCLSQTTAFAITPQAIYCATTGIIAKRLFGDDQSRLLARNLGPVTSMVVDATNLYVAYACKLAKLPL